MTDSSATLTIHKTGQTIELPIFEGSCGPDVIDVRNLYKDTGMFTYDPGFMSTASCDSKITFIDGKKGELFYRGYPIDQLAKHSSYLEVCFLLLYSRLPSREELVSFETDIIEHYMMVHESVRKFFSGFHHDAHPMSMTLAILGALSSFYHDSTDIKKPKHRDMSALRLIAKMPTIAAYSFKSSTGFPLMYPRADLSYTENFLHMMFASPIKDYKINKTAAKALDLIFILHADHEQNASTSTVRVSGSSGTNPFASVAAGVASLWGPAHGGANEAVIRMLEKIGDKKNIGKYVARAKDKSDSFRLMGFGHRVYKNFDPRATIIREACHEVLNELENTTGNPLFKTALELEKIALEDEYFVKRSLYPNVDFYSGLILRALDIPLNMFTVIFAMSRTAGWIAQWNEMLDEPDLKISRPRQLYTGDKPRDYVPIDKR